VIELRSVTKVFEGLTGQEVRAVNEVSLSVNDGETLCLIGTSGSGKTTCMKMINRLVEPSEGEILVGGSEVRSLDPIRLRRSIGYVIQRGGLMPHLTVAKNIGLICRLEGWVTEKINARVRELLELVNLPPDDYLHRYPSELSGGQRQRVGVARALALDPNYILMDEPFGALDPITREGLHDEFLRLKAEVRKCTVIVTHDLHEAFKLGDRIALLDQGRLIQVGTEEDFLYRPASKFVQDFVSNHVSTLQLTVAQALEKGPCDHSGLEPLLKDSPIKAALTKLLESSLNEWPVVDSHNNPVGKVTVKSVLRCLS
jgi:osmoprotectant transport system ATP-binding protein